LFANRADVHTRRVIIPQSAPANFLNGKILRYRSSGGEQCRLEFDAGAVTVTNVEGGSHRSPYRVRGLGSNRVLMCWRSDHSQAELLTVFVDFNQGKLTITRPFAFDTSPFDEAEILSLDTR
jgi:hypothetical protein